MNRVRDTIANAPISVVFAALIAAGALLLGLYVAFTSDMRAQLRAETQADIDAASAADRVLPAVTALTVLDRQTSRSGRAGPLYLLIDPETHRPLAGNLPAWPKIDFGPDGCGSINGFAGGRPMIGCTTRLDGHFPLVIARSTSGIGTTRDWMLVGYGALAIIVTIAGAAAGWFRLSRLRRRLTGIQGALDSFAKGDLAARPPMDGTDGVGELASGVGRVLDDLNHAITGQHVIAERIAHDFKRPVAIALATLDLQRSPAEALAACRDRLTDLNRIVDGILRISEIAMRDDPMEPVALDTAVQAVADLYADAAALRGVEIRVDLEPVVVMGRGELIDRLLANLIDNAVKYTAPATVVCIDASVNAGAVVLRVMDQGPGKAGLPVKPGTYFARGAAGNDVEGSGLGLASVRRIVELAKGHLQFDDRTDTRGLIVEVMLPTGIPTS